MSVLNTAEENIANIFSWNKQDKIYYIGTLTTLVPVGAFIGCLSTGFLSKLGRRVTMMFVDLLSIIGVILCLSAILKLSTFLLIVGRFICGFTSGVNTAIVALYINEMSPDAITGKMGTYN